MSAEYITVNLEEGMPTAELAIRRLTYFIKSSQERGVKLMKVIHGFGSSGAGGRIRKEARTYLASMKRRGQIRAFVPGEEFSVFDAGTRALLDECPELRRDRDLERHNNGITLILL